MQLKPSTPFFELILLPMLLILLLKMVITHQTLWIFIAEGLIILFFIVLAYSINHHFRTYGIAGSLVIKNYFIGLKEIELNTIGGYYIQHFIDRKQQKTLHIVLIDKYGKTIVKIGGKDYPAPQWRNFVDAMTASNIPFLGNRSLHSWFRNFWHI